MARDTVTMAVTITDEAGAEVSLEVIGTTAAIDSWGLEIRNGLKVVLAVPLPFFSKLELPG